MGRPTDTRYTLTPSGGATTTVYEVQPTYDALSNVLENVTTLPQGTDTQIFCYDTLNRLTSSPLGSYTYGDSAHVDAATSIGSGSGAWTASYDASGNLTCRAPSGATTCAGNATGNALSYNNEGQLATWQSVPSSPTATDTFLYDGEGQPRRAGRHHQRDDGDHHLCGRPGGGDDQRRDDHNNHHRLLRWRG